MDEYTLTIKSIEKITKDVLRITTSRPNNYTFTPGQATEVSINKEGWVDKKRPFTFTCLPNDDHLEFTIKTYTDHDGVTNQLLTLNAGDEIIIGDSWGTIGYKGEGTFIAGGAGVTPFISILRHLKSNGTLKNSKLLFANKTTQDIINKNEFEHILGNNFINILSDEDVEGYAHGFIGKDFLKSNISDFSKHIYLCGPKPMMDAVEKHLHDIGIEKSLIVKEEF